MTQEILGQGIIDLMRQALTEVAKQFQQLRDDITEQTLANQPLKNGMLASLDLNLACIHLLGSKLANAVPEKKLMLETNERLIVGFCTDFLDERIANIINSALQGNPINDEEIKARLTPKPTIQ